jgi:hypothetical protein
MVSPSASSVTATQRTIDGWRPVMFDYRNLNSDYRRPLPPDPGDAWVWIAGAILLVLVLAVAFVSAPQQMIGGWSSKNWITRGNRVLVQNTTFTRYQEGLFSCACLPLRVGVGNLCGYTLW